MDADVISPSYGVAAHQQEIAIDNNFRLETQSVFEDHQQSISSFSVISRWYKLRNQFKDMKGKIQQWCQNDTQTMADLEFLAPSAFGIEGATIRFQTYASASCDALTELKETCESLVIYKQELAHAEKQYAVAAKKRTDADKQMVPNDPSAENDSALELLRIVLAAQANLASMCAKLVFSYANYVVDGVNTIYLAHCVVRGLLEALGAAGNGTSFISPWDHDNQSNARDDLEDRSSFSLFRNVCHPYEMELDKLDFLPTLDANHKARLGPLYNILKLVLGRAALLKNKDKNNNKRIDATVKGINEWKTADQSTTKFSAPGCESQEREGTQPVLYAIMSQMVHVLGLEQHITREQDMAKVKSCSARRVDFVVTQVDERAILPATLGIPIEVKRNTRKKAGVAQLSLETLDQVVGRLAKRAMFSFDFGGIGEDCQVVGLEVSMGCRCDCPHTRVSERVTWKSQHNERNRCRSSMQQQGAISSVRRQRMWKPRLMVWKNRKVLLPGFVSLLACSWPSTLTWKHRF
ncbi:hypothetical protein MHU86_1530 [Fragilaria crotonensis]|nr:hypothetical protein MHU86_1530 [Fragilaria crotonensis]